MSASSDAMYNADSRYIEKKYIIHFSPSVVLTVTGANYLIDSSVLEEAYKVSDSPFGDITSNELSLNLFNDNGIFNPRNTQSPYYGLIKKGAKIEAFIRIDEVDDWDPLGVFYVTDWVLNAAGTSADVTANDILYDVLNGATPQLPVYRDTLFSSFIEIYFNAFGLSVDVDEAITDTLPYIYTSEHTENKKFLTDLLTSVGADCFCDHSGNIKIVSKIAERSLRTTISDEDQIMDVSIKQSIVTSYDSVSVSFYTGQESEDQTIISADNISIAQGINGIGPLAFSKHPVLAVKAISTTGSSKVEIQSINTSAVTFNCSLRSTSDTLTKIQVLGTLLETVVGTLEGTGDTPLKIDTKFIQNAEMAEKIKSFCERYIDANNPTVELTIRGNPLLQLSDKILVHSTRYKLTFTGILVKAVYDYQGSLSCKITLSDASVLEEV